MNVKFDLDNISTEDLIDKFRETDDISIKDEIILRQKSDVASVVRKHASWKNSCDLSDLEQEAWIGVMQALEKFDRTYGVPFRIYARQWAKQKARYCIYTRGRTVKTPLSVITAIRNIKEANKTLTKKLGREPYISELSKKMRISHDDIAKFMLADSSIFSISGSVENDDGNNVCFDPCDNEKLPDELAMFSDELEFIMELVKNELTEREKNVLEWRLGLNGQNPHKLYEIAKIENVTTVGAGSIFRRAIEKLKMAYRRKNTNEDHVFGHRNDWPISQSN